MRFLRAEIKKLEQKIDMDEKMKKMGDMQLSAVSDSKKRKTILEQVRYRVQSASQTQIYCSTFFFIQHYTTFTKHPMFWVYSAKV